MLHTSLRIIYILWGGSSECKEFFFSITFQQERYLMLIYAVDNKHKCMAKLIYSIFKNYFSIFLHVRILNENYSLKTVKFQLLHSPTRVTFSWLVESALVD